MGIGLQITLISTHLPEANCSKEIFFIPFLQSKRGKGAFESEALDVR